MATARKMKSGNWRCLAYVGMKDGKRQYKSFTAPTKKEAELKAAQYEGENNFEKVLTLGEAFDSYIDARSETLSPTTQNEYERCRRLYFQNLMELPITKIDRPTLQSALNNECVEPSKRYKKGKSRKTILNNFSLLLSVLRYYDIEFSMKKFKLPQKIEKPYITPDPSNMTRILRATYETPLELPVLFAMWHSFRRGEVAGLRWDDIDWKNKIIRIDRSIVYVNGVRYVKPPKNTSSQRIALLSDYLIERLKYYKARSDSEYIIDKTPSAITHAFPRMLEKNDIPHCTFHSLRHAFVSAGKSLNIPDVYLMRMGGWSSDRVMKKNYLQFFSDVEMDASKKMSDYFYSMMNINNATQNATQG